MRYSSEHNARSREKILTAARAQFAERGYAATGIDTIMKAAGLVPGTFYSHFKSKRDLFKHAMQTSLDRGTANFASLVKGVATPSDGLAAIAASYLSRHNRDYPADGCPLPCLAAEIGREPQAFRAATEQGLTLLVDSTVEALGNAKQSITRKEMLGALSTMVGALALARMVSTPAFSEEILAAGVSACEQLVPATRKPAKSRRQ